MTKLSPNVTPDLLGDELTALKSIDYDLSLLGWGDAELDMRLAPHGNKGLADPDDVPAPPDAATTQPGDLIILGNHIRSAATAGACRISTACLMAS